MKRVHNIATMTESSSADKASSSQLLCGRERQEGSDEEVDAGPVELEMVSPKPPSGALRELVNGSMSVQALQELLQRLIERKEVIQSQKETLVEEEMELYDGISAVERILHLAGDELE